MLDNPKPKVRQTVAFVYYKLSEFVPEIIFDNTNNLELMINLALNHLNDHPLISCLLIGALKNLFVQASLRNNSHMLNNYFPQIFG